ncbi:FixH family protein [Flavobacterium cheniae]|jgi:hypothetical protein|uniref:YtkA-like protein n=1 Tax=Flavobacterium cheniae TaxID=295428 RepID=A0A562KRY3_9FLAO|nr:FixH family protein [Flavobacterium cheniae]TDR25615.1 YtkA-like protein [Flavobacterium cheniae]TWH98198.1 YtkA-like protein [Flavobacterium cheniae]
MKTSIKYLVAIFAIAFTFVSCSNDDETTVNELDGITKIKEITNDTHTIELYSQMGSLEQGYNEISLRIKDNTTDKYIKNAEVSWAPLMHMTSMSHSCPYSAVEKVTENGTLYSGYIMFQMAQNETEYWDLKIDYTIDEVTYTITEVIDVPASAKRKVNTFMGSDGTKYLVALIEPNTPKVAINNMQVGVWKMQNMMTFPVVDGYTVKIDPRMPSMGNHTSPNNVHATQATTGGLYDGKLSLTMTGYWKINLQLANAEGTVLKGEEITETVTASSIFFEIEF